MKINNAWNIKQFPTKYVVELADRSLWMFDIVPFRDITASGLSPYKGIYPEKVNGTLMPEYIYGFYGLERNTSDADGPVPGYIPIKDYATQHGVNPANIRQKILRGTLAAKKFGNEWFLDKNTPYLDKRRKEE